MAARGRAGPFSCLSPFPFLCQRLLGTSFPGEHCCPSSLSPAPQEVPWILLWSLFQVLDTIPSDRHNYNNQHLLSSYCLLDCDAQDVCIIALNPLSLPLMSLLYKPGDKAQRGGINLHLNPLQLDPSAQAVGHRAWLPPEGKRNGPFFPGRDVPSSDSLLATSRREQTQHP